MIEERQNEYFRKSGTFAPSIAIDLDIPKTNKGTIDAIKDTNLAPDEGLINQNIIKVGDYRRNKATRKEIAHVRFEPD
jgi:hypothetical protein